MAEINRIDAAPWAPIGIFIGEVHPDDAVPNAAAGSIYLRTNGSVYSKGGAWAVLAGGGGATGAPTSAEYIMRAVHAELSAERALTDTGEVTWDYGTAHQVKAILAAVPWAKLSGVPGTFAPSAHGHIQGDITGLAASLAAKSDTGHGHAQADVTNLVADLAARVLLAGQLGNTAASPDVRGLRETSGPTLLTLGAVADTHALARSGSTLIGKPIPVCKLGTADQTIGTSATTITALQHALLAGKKYRFRYLIHYNSVAAATVHAARVLYSGTLGAAATMESVFTVSGTNGVPSVWAAAGRIHTLAVNGALVTTTGGIGNTGSAGAMAQFEVEGVIFTGTAGNLDLQCISSAASGLVTQAGQLLEIWEIG